MGFLGVLLARVGPFAIVAGLIASIFVIKLEPVIPAVPEPLIAKRDRFFGMAVVDQGAIWLVGSNGKILRSAAHGRDWTRQQAATASTLQGIAAFDGARAIAVGNGGTIIHTADGGANWHSAAAPAELGGAKLFRVRLDSEGRAWAVGEFGTLIRSADGGATWSPAVEKQDVAWNDVTFANHDVGWAVGEFGYLLRTVDGGATWTQAETPVKNSLNATVACDGVALAVGLNGVVLRSTDDGLTWKTMQSVTREHLYEIACRDGRWVAAGDRGVFVGGAIGGETAALLATGAENVWHTSVVLSGDDIYASGATSGVSRKGAWMRFAS